MQERSNGTGSDGNRGCDEVRERKDDDELGGRFSKEGTRELAEAVESRDYFLQTNLDSNERYFIYLLSSIATSL